MTRTLTLAAALLAISLVAACGEPEGENAPPDLGSATDAGTALDANDQNNSLEPDMGARADLGEDAGADAELDLGRAITFIGEGPCDTSGVDASHATTLPVESVQGDFGVQVRFDARIDVTHTRAGARSLFASPRGGPVFTVGTHELHAEENQGSFEVEEKIKLQCQSPIVDTVYDAPNALVLQGSFEDPGCEEIRFEWHMCELSDGQLGMGLTTDDPEIGFVELRAASSRTEKIYGMGEQFPHDELDLKGRAIPVLSQEGGVGRGRQPISAAVNAVSTGSAGSEETTYYAAPHYITSELRSLFLEETDYAVFDFEPNDAILIRLFSPTLTARVLEGDSPLGLVSRFTEWAGRMPAPPDWVADGAVVALAGDLDFSADVIDDLLAAGAAVTGVWNQTWSGTSNTFIGEQVLWHWIQNPNRHPTWQNFVDDMEAKGVKTLCYINPMLRDLPEDAGPLRRNLYQEAVDNDYFIKNEEGEDLEIEVTAFTVGLVDFTNPAARDWYKGVIKDEMITGARCSGWMADFAEATPFEAVVFDGTPGATYHNQYPVDWIQLNREAIEEAGVLGDVFVFNRSGAARTPRHAMMLWQGDQLTTWDRQDGLISALHGLLNGGFSGIALNHSDVGGYTSLSRYGLGYKREEEQLARWAELNAFSAAMRTHQGNQPDANAQIYSDQAALARFARMTKLYRALGFYRKQLYADATQKGWPVVRHMLMEFPDDEKAWEIDDQLMFGSEILMAPIVEKCSSSFGCTSKRRVYLPAGTWTHFWSGATYGSESEGSEIEIDAPFGQPAAFYRANSPIASQLEANLQAEGLK